MRFTNRSPLPTHGGVASLLHQVRKRPIPRGLLRVYHSDYEKLHRKGWNFTKTLFRFNIWANLLFPVQLARVKEPAIARCPRPCPWVHDLALSWFAMVSIRVLKLLRDKQRKNVFLFFPSSLFSTLLVDMTSWSDWWSCIKWSCGRTGPRSTWSNRSISSCQSSACEIRVQCSICSSRFCRICFEF